MIADLAGSVKPMSCLPGYDLLWVLLVSQLALMVTQEAGARLGLATGHGLSGLIREVFDGLLLPIILVFVMLLARNPKVMGELRSGRRAMLLGWSVTVGIGLLSVALVISQLV
jgi:Mn2+/Fe2+ NRAMP family transporter